MTIHSCSTPNLIRDAGHNADICKVRFCSSSWIGCLSIAGLSQAFFVLDYWYSLMHFRKRRHNLEQSFLRKGWFHWRRSRSRSRESGSDLMKIESWSHKRSHELNGIGVRRIRTVPFSSVSAYDFDTYDPVKTRLSES